MAEEKKLPPRPERGVTKDANKETPFATEVEIKFGFMNPNGMCYDSTGSCSIAWLNGFYGRRVPGPANGSYAPPKISWEFNQKWADMYRPPVMCLLTDDQLNERWSPGVNEALRKAGFVEVVAWMSSHGKYKCHLFVCETRRGTADQWNPAEAYTLYPNPNLAEELKLLDERFKEKK